MKIQPRTTKEFLEIQYPLVVLGWVAQNPRWFWAKCKTIQIKFQLSIFNIQSISNFQYQISNWKLKIDNWKLKINWKLNIENWKFSLSFWFIIQDSKFQKNLGIWNFEFFYNLRFLISFSKSFFICQ